MKNKLDCDSVLKMFDLLLNQNESCLKISKIMNVSRMMVYKVFYRISWKECENEIQSFFGENYENKVKEKLKLNLRRSKGRYCRK